MAREVTIGGDGTLFRGEDKTLRLEVLDSSDIPVDMTGWTVKFGVRRTFGPSDPLVIDKTAAISGVYNSVRASNTQRAVVTLTDDDTEALDKAKYSQSWKRMTADSETVLAYGPFVIDNPTVF